MYICVNKKIKAMQTTQNAHTVATNFGLAIINRAVNEGFEFNENSTYEAILGEAKDYIRDYCEVDRQEPADMSEDRQSLMFEGDVTTGTFFGSEYRDHQSGDTWVIHTVISKAGELVELTYTKP